MNAVDDPERGNAHVETEYAYVEQRKDSRREAGPSSGRQVTFTDSNPLIHDNISHQGPDSVEVGNRSSLLNVPHDMRGLSLAEHDLARNRSTIDKYPSYVYTDSRL